MNNRNLVRNIKLLLAFFSVCFFGIIIYLTYFSLYKSEEVALDVSNPRIRAEEEDVLRGSILDRDGNKIAYSQKTEDGKQKRIYNNGEAYAHILGYSSYVYGKTGLELAYNNILLGKKYGGDILQVLFQGIKGGFSSNERYGYDVYLSIDKDAQNAAYKMLGNDKGAVAAVNTKTGEIIALVSKPTFSPGLIDTKFDEYNNDKKGTPFVNRAAQGYYAPGSVFKIVTAAAALENNPEIADETFNCVGGLKIGTYTLRDHGGAVHGKVSLNKAFRVSCNNAFGLIGIELGYDKLEDMAEKFMFNQEIEVSDIHDSLNIRAGNIKIDDEKMKALVAQDAIGQHGVTTNPLHMALITSAIANDGVMMKPYIVKEVKDRDGNIIEKEKPEELRTVISKNTADKIKEYMVDVVKSGTGTRAKISGITVGGKTGSAENENYEETHSWFTAFAPAEDPEIAVAVIVEEGGQGGKRAAEIAREVIEAYLKK